MNLKKLNKKIRKLDDTFNYVNHGGCGCVAAMLAVAFRPRFPIMRITSTGMYGDNNDLDSIREELDDRLSKDDWYQNGVHFSHVWVEVFIKKSWYVLDATGIHSRSRMYSEWGIPAKGSFSIDEIQALADETSWNSMFNRNQLPDMQKMIDNLLPAVA